MKKFIFFILSLLLTTIYTYAQEKGKVKKTLPIQNSQLTSLKTHESKNTQQLTDIKLKLAILKAAKKDRNISKKAKKLALKNKINRNKQLIKERVFTEKIIRKDKKQLEKALTIAEKEETKKIKNKSKTKRTIALQTKLKQKKQLIKKSAITEKIERKDKKQLKKALTIAKKEESKKEKNIAKTEKTIVLQTEIKQKKQLTKQRIISKKKTRKAKNQLELALAISEKETFKEIRIRSLKEITNTLKIQLAQKKLLIKQRAMTEKSAQRTKIQSDIAQIITTKEALKKARFKAKKAKMIAYDGEVRKIYR